MAGLYRNLLLLSLAMYVVCMLVSLADTAPIEDDSVRERRWALGGPGGGRNKPPRGHPSIVDVEAIKDESVRERRWANGGPGGGRSKIPQGGGHGNISVSLRLGDTKILRIGSWMAIPRDKLGLSW